MSRREDLGKIGKYGLTRQTKAIFFQIFYYGINITDFILLKISEYYTVESINIRSNVQEVIGVPNLMTHLQMIIAYGLYIFVDYCDRNINLGSYKFVD